MPLYGPVSDSEGVSKGRYLRPAQTALVAAVVCESAIGRNDVVRNALTNEILNLGDTGKLLSRHK
jgi:hypothetical protein